MRIISWFKDTLCLSAKPIAAVTDGIVTFEDSSWADLNARKYIGKGPGSVYLLNVPDKSAFSSAAIGKPYRLEHGTHASFHGEAHVIIEEHDEDVLAIELFGQPEFVAATTIRTTGETVDVRFPVRNGPYAVTFVNGRQVEGPEVQGIARCKFPRNTTISIHSNRVGRVWIEPLVKLLEVTIDGSTRVSCLQAERINTRISGSGDVFVGCIHSTANIEISGSGSVRLAGGQLEQIVATVSGSGSVLIGAVASKAMLKQTGSGVIVCSRVMYHVTEEHYGSGYLAVLEYGQI